VSEKGQSKGKKLRQQGEAIIKSQKKKAGGAKNLRPAKIKKKKKSKQTPKKKRVNPNTGWEFAKKRGGYNGWSIGTQKETPRNQVRWATTRLKESKREKQKNCEGQDTIMVKQLTVTTRIFWV